MVNNFGDKINSNGFDKRPEDAKKGGRKPSIDKQLLEILDADGNMTIPKENVVVRKKDGRVIIKVSTQLQLALRLSELALKGTGPDSFKALKLIIDRIDGKPNQILDINHNNPQNAMPKVKVVYIKERNVGIGDGNKIQNDQE